MFFYSWKLYGKKNLPFTNELFNYVMCIAVIHHLSTEERRLKALEEISRVLKLGGEALIYVWSIHNNFEQPRFENEHENNTRC